MTGEVGGVIYEGYWRFCDLQTFVGLKDVGLEVWGLKEGLQNTSTKPDTDYTLERLHFGVLQTQTDPIDKSLRDHNQEPPESLHNSLQPASIAVTPPIQSRFETLNLKSKRSIRQRPSQIARCCMLAELGCLPQGS